MKYPNLSLRLILGFKVADMDIDLVDYAEISCNQSDTGYSVH
jgi:hypothetical protein